MNFEKQNKTLQEFFDENNIPIICEDYNIISFFNHGGDLQNNLEIKPSKCTLADIYNWYIFDGINNKGEDIKVIAIELKITDNFFPNMYASLKYLRKVLNEHGYEFFVLDQYVDNPQVDNVKNANLKEVQYASILWENIEFAFQYKENVIFIIDDKYFRSIFETWVNSGYWCYLYNINKYAIIRENLHITEQYFDKLMQ